MRISLPPRPNFFVFRFSLPLAWPSIASSGAPVELRRRPAHT